MVRVKLRANLGSNDFPKPLCNFTDGEEHDVSDEWAAKLVAQRLAVVIESPAATVVVEAHESIQPVAEQKQERPASEPERSPVNKPKKER